MKILLQTLNYPGIGGIERSIESIKHALLEEGHEVMIVAKNTGHHEVSVDYTFSTPKYLEWLPLSNLRETLSFWLWLMRNQIVYKDIDMIISRYIYLSLPVIHYFPEIKHQYIPPALYADLYNGILSALKDRTGFYNSFRKLYIRLTKRIDQLIESKVVTNPDIKMTAFSENVRNRICLKHNLHVDRIVVQASGVDSAFHYIDQQKARNHLQSIDNVAIKNHDYIVLFVGRLFPGKNPALLLSAFQSLDRENKKLLYVGVGEELEFLHSKADSKSVIFVGNKDKEELKYYYNAADVMVLPTYKEGYGHVFAESIVCGTPILGFGTGNGCSTATSEFVADISFGRVISPVGNKIENLAESLKDMGVNLKTFRENRKLLARTASDKYKWATFVNSLLQ